MLSVSDVKYSDSRLYDSDPIQWLVLEKGYVGNGTFSGLLSEFISQVTSANSIHIFAIELGSVPYAIVVDFLSPEILPLKISLPTTPSFK